MTQPEPTDKVVEEAVTREVEAWKRYSRAVEKTLLTGTDEDTFRLRAEGWRERRIAAEDLLNAVMHVDVLMLTEMTKN